MNSTKVKYLRGWIKFDSMNQNAWFASWAKTALDSDVNKTQLVVFEIPDNLPGKNAVEQIEILLQEKFGK